MPPLDPSRNAHLPHAAAVGIGELATRDHSRNADARRLRFRVVRHRAGLRCLSGFRHNIVMPLGAPITDRAR